MSTDNNTWMVCVPWGEHSVPSNVYNCTVCRCQVAIDKQNVSKGLELGAQPICMRCAVQRFKDEEEPELSGLVSGRKVQVSDDFMDRLRKYVWRRNN